MHAAFVVDQEMLRSELRNLLTELNVHTSEPLSADMALLLAAPGKLLSSSNASARVPMGFWALLPLTIARYCVPSAEAKLISRIALVCEFLHSALDCFDEIEDDDSSEQRTLLGDGRFLNTATLLYTLIPLTLDTLCPAYLSAEQLRFLQRYLLTEVVSAMHGQHRDILAEQAALDTFSPEECMRIVSAKSGVLFRLICCFAAQAVNAKNELVHYFADIGALMGIVAQLENDIHGLEKELAAHGKIAQKSDLRRSKKTLPIVLARKQLMSLGNTEKDGQEELLQMTAYDQAIKATLGAADHLREKALTLVPCIEHVQGETLPSELHVLLNLVKTY